MMFRYLRNLYLRIYARILFWRFVRKFGSDAPNAIMRAYPGTRKRISDDGKTVVYPIAQGVVFTVRYDEEMQ